MLRALQCLHTLRELFIANTGEQHVMTMTLDVLTNNLSYHLLHRMLSEDSDATLPHRLGQSKCHRHESMMPVLIPADRAVEFP